MVIDTSKPVEVVANWDETIVYRATLLEVLDNDDGFHISIDERYQVFKDDGWWPAGEKWDTLKDGTLSVSFNRFGHLTLRNVQEVDEITWENCPEWAKDEAAKRIGFDSWSQCNYRCTIDWPLFDWKTCVRQLALMIAKYEKPTDPSIEIAREIVKRYYPYYPEAFQLTGDDPRLKIAVDAYRRAIKDQKDKEGD